MRIEGVRTRERGASRRAEARVLFEDSTEPPRTVWFEVPAEHAAHLVEAPDAFLLAAFPAAAWVGERRLLVEGSVSVRLRRNLEQAGRLFRAWRSECLVPEIEARDGFHAPVGASGRRTGAFLSGGVDSLASLRRNRLDLPRGHPGSVTHGVYAFGLNHHDFDPSGEPAPERLRAFDAQRVRLESLGERQGVEVVPVRTNARLLYPTWEAWGEVGSSAVTAATAMVLSRLFREVLFGSTGLGPLLPPHSQHPLLDPLLESDDLRVVATEAYLTRHEKVGIVAGFEDAFPCVQACLLHELPSARPNCGRCRKCLLTMLSFAAHGVLDRIPAFDPADLSAERVARLRLPPILAGTLGEDLLADLARRGLHDLVRAVRRVAARARETPWQRRRRKWLRSIRRRLPGAGSA